jgi:hypothetical protein
MDLKEAIVLDGIDTLPDNSGFRVRSHDFYGPLPEIMFKDSGDTFQDKDRLSNKVCKLVAIVRLRDQMARFLPGCKLLPPTSMAAKAVVGHNVGTRTWLEEVEAFLAAHHEFRKHVLR